MQQPSDSVLLNICVIPNEQVSKDCVAISQSLETEATMFVLGNGKFAHMTVFMARFANDRIPEVVEATRRALQTIAPFRCEHSGYFMTEGRYLEASYRKTAEFLALQEAIIKHAAGLRISPSQPYKEGYFAPYTDEQRRNAEETGYDLVQNLYRPHVTLTRYKENMVPKEFPAFPATALSFNLAKLSVYKADENGAAVELVKEFAPLA